MIEWIKGLTPVVGILIMIGVFIYSNIMSGREIKERFDKACDERKEIKADIKQLNQNFIEHL